jgi:hypothetical protein
MVSACGESHSFGLTLMADTPSDPKAASTDMHSLSAAAPSHADLSQTQSSDESPPSHQGSRGIRYENADPVPPPFAVISLWEMNALTWCLGTPSEDLSRDIQTRQIDKAAATWSRADGITLSRVARCSSADIVINFYMPGTTDAAGTDFEEDTADLALASSGVPYGAHQIEIQVNDGREWAYQARLLEDGQEDLQTVLLHELGHALGLDHSDNDLSVMSPYYVGQQRALHWDDVHGIREMYGSFDGPCADSAAVAMLAYEATLTSSEAAEDAHSAFPAIPRALRAQEALASARVDMWNAYYSAYYSDLIGPEYATEAMGLIALAVDNLELGRQYAQRTVVATGSMDAQEATTFAADGIWLAIAAHRHALACQAGTSL